VAKNRRSSARKKAIMLITPNFEEAVEFVATPPGIYKARITSHEVKTSQKGDTYVNWTWTLFGAEGDYAKYNGREVKGITMVTGKGAGRLKELLTVCGLEAVSGQAFDPSSLYGKEALLTLKSRTMPDGTVSNYPDIAAIKPIAQ